MTFSLFDNYEKQLSKSSLLAKMFLFLLYEADLRKNLLIYYLLC